MTTIVDPYYGFPVTLGLLKDLIMKDKSITEVFRLYQYNKHHIHFFCKENSFSHQVDAKSANVLILMLSMYLSQDVKNRKALVFRSGFCSHISRQIALFRLPPPRESWL
jgi:hypothetical protein